MRRLFLAFFLVMFISSLSLGENQSLRVIKARLGPTKDISHFAQERYRQWCILYEKIYIKEEIDLNKLTPDQKKLFYEFDDSQGFWATDSGGCSWYCGGGPKKQEASSCLQPQGGSTYYAKNAHDIDLRTAWIEGAKGYGIGEYIEYYFEALSPRVTEILIYNGYFKSEQAWEDNSRVKTMKLYVNNKPYAILELFNTRAVQCFKVEPLQSNIKGKDMILKFEILDIYKGQKWDDVAISEINFDGLDVHCFTKGTLITMADGTDKPIEELQIGDKIKSYNIDKRIIETSVIKEMANALHRNLVKLDFQDVSIICTDDHPFYVSNKGWCSINPRKSRIYKNMENIGLLEIGDSVFYIKQNEKLTVTSLKSISYLDQNELTYTITKLDKNIGFFANKLLVGIEDM